MTKEPYRMLLERRLPNRLEHVNVFIKEALVQFGALPLSGEEIFNLKLSLEEALTNAMRHGNRLDPDRFVDVSVAVEGDRLVMKVKDEGDGFDFSRVPDPTHHENKEKPHGRGVFLIKQLMSEVTFFDNGSGIRMVKFLKGI
ncbi:MAG: ATP-binding protein [Deltaproteobacteria bacterium]